MCHLTLLIGVREEDFALGFFFEDELEELEQTRSEAFEKELGKAGMLLRWTTPVKYNGRCRATRNTWATLQLQSCNQAARQSGCVTSPPKTVATALQEKIAAVAAEHKGKRPLSFLQEEQKVSNPQKACVEYDLQLASVQQRCHWKWRSTLKWFQPVTNTRHQAFW